MLSVYLFPHEDYLLVMAQGRLDAIGAGTFDQKTEDSYPTSKFWVIDCSKLLFLSSAGIRSLIQAVKKLRNQDGNLILLSPGDQIRQVLEMSGLSGQFIICEDIKEAEEKIARIKGRQERVGDFTVQNRHYSFKALPAKGSEIFRWQPGPVDESPLLVSLQELGVAIGKGCMAENREQASHMNGTFISFPGFFFFSPDRTELPSDYFAGKADAPQGFYISDAYSVKGEAGFQADVSVLAEVPVNLIIREIGQLISKWENTVPGMIYFTGLSESNHLMVGCYSDEEMMLHNPGIDLLWGDHWKNEDIMLAYASLYCKEESLSHDLKDLDMVPSLLKNTDPGKSRLLTGDRAVSGKLRFWVYFPDKVVDAASSRIDIVYEDKMEKPEEWELIIREIYRDAGKVVLKQLHGGFSAQTFQVASFNKQGKRTIPTVLKLGKIPIVEREEKNYRDHVQQYILNNSTTIMGAHYYGEWGGIRYNFLGINGPETQLTWLTHLYKEKPAEELKPVFDFIFKTILKPWYGQPKLESIPLWKSHYPLEPLFPNLLSDAEKVLGISNDVETLDCPYLGRKIMNPYWFLKHEWPKYLGENRLWYSSVCHGDLNMQNILLDETDNIYIIDFSETKPRNIVSDFARLEPIFKIEMTRNSKESDLREKLLMEESLLGIGKLTDRPEFRYTGDDPMMRKAYEMVLQVREYARMTMIFEEDLVPYWLAVLEWTLPYASYWSVPVQMQWHAAYSAGMILEKIMKVK
jgi:anti-anti-sigma factor